MAKAGSSPGGDTVLRRGFDPYIVETLMEAAGGSVAESVAERGAERFDSMFDALSWGVEYEPSYAKTCFTSQKKDD